AHPRRPKAVRRDGHPPAVDCYLLQIQTPSSQRITTLTCRIPSTSKPLATIAGSGHRRALAISRGLSWRGEEDKVGGAVPKLPADCRPGPVNWGADRPQRNSQRRGDLLIGEIFHVAQHDCCSHLMGKFRQRVLHIISHVAMFKCTLRSLLVAAIIEPVIRIGG